MIDQLITLVTQKLGLSTDEARGGVGVLFALMQKFGDEGAVGDLLNKLPGATTLASEQANNVDTGGGSGGGLAGMVGGLLGGNAGDAMEALGALKNVGLDMDQAKSLVPVVAEFAREHAGEDVLKKAADSVPFLKQFL